MSNVDLRDHAFFIYRNKGMSRCMRGNVLVEIVFVEDDRTDWKQREMDRFYDVFKDAIKGLVDQAKTAGVFLNVSSAVSRITYSGVMDPGTLSSDVIPGIHSAYLLKQGFTTYTDYASSRKRQYHMDEVATMFVLESKFRAFAQTGEGQEYCVLTETDNAHAIGHELLHLFGAVDLYHPYQVYGLTMDYFPETIMCTYEGMQVDPLTQYLVGWTNTLSPKAREFMTKLQDYTVERYYRALTLEFYRDNEQQLLQRATPYSSMDDIRKQAVKCDPWAEFLLGLCFRDGIGLKANAALAEKYFARSGRTGLNPAAYAHAQMLLHRGLRTDQDRENLWLILNYNSGNHLQLASLRIACLLTGVGGRQDQNWANDNTIHQYQEAEQFVRYAQRSSWFYRVLEKLSGNLPQLQRAVNQMRLRYERMVQEGDPDLLYLVARMLEEGKHVCRDLSGALTLYQQSAENGNYLSCLALGRCYREGIGTARDLSAAKKWVAQAAVCCREYPWDAFCRLMQP